MSYNKAKKSMLQTTCNRGPKIINIILIPQLTASLCRKKYVIFDLHGKFDQETLKSFCSSYYWIWRKDFYISIYHFNLLLLDNENALDVSHEWIVCFTQWSKLSVGNASESEISRF